jgi:hypothetical protein
MSDEKLNYLADRITQTLLAQRRELGLTAPRDEVYRHVMLALRHDAGREAAIEARAAGKITSMKRHIPEDSPEWSALLRRFVEEEMDKLRVVRRDW